MIELKNIEKSFKENVILDGVSFTVNDGDCVGIVGHNGCGKSVLLKLICGFMKPDGGEVSVNGKTVGKDSDFIENAGVIINAPMFMMHMTAFDNLKMLAEIRKKIGDDTVRETLKLVRLDPDSKKKVKTFSQGMLQRLRLAQAFMEDPEILILDEPMNYIDRDGKIIIDELINKAKSENKTVIFTSHDMTDVHRYSDYILKIEDGKLIRIENDGRETA